MSSRILFIIVLLSPLVSWCSDLHLSKPILYLEDGTAHAVFNISWNNAWRNKKNHDAIWLCFKSIPQSGNSRHLKVLSKGHEQVSDFSPRAIQLAWQVAEDATGLFVFPGETFSGQMSLTLKVALDPTVLATILICSA